MLDHRVYRAAFLPALVALFVVAFSLTEPPGPRTTRLAPLAFDSERAFGPQDPPPRNSLRELAASFPQRLPGGSGDAALADRVAAAFERSGFAGEGVRRVRFAAEGIRGETDSESVIATREGLSGRAIVVLAHRDAQRGPAAAELSGTAALLELSRLLADRDLERTVVLASVSGGSGGFSGAREITEQVGPVDAVIVLGNLASQRQRRPFVVPWANGRDPAPYSLERTLQAALRRETGTDAGRSRASFQWMRRALPLTISEQGEVQAPAVLVSATGERRPRANAPIRLGRFDAFGRSVLRALTATLEAPRSEPFPESDGIVALGRLVPTWALRLLIGALLLPALLAALDAFFRVRRRGLSPGRWSLWAASFALAPLVAWGWARLLDATGAVTALPAPAPGGAVPLDAAGAAAMASVVIVGAVVAVWVRPLLVRRIGARGDVRAGGAAAATGLLLAGLASAVWLFAPYAAAVLLPAAHAWLLATAPGHRSATATAVAAVAVGLLAPLLVLAYYAHAWGLGPVEGAWVAFGIVAGGVLGPLDALVFSLFVATLCATVVILRKQVRAQKDDDRSDDTLVTRGPRSYAGPGSLGGTESALRR